jgi:hypothetical protein
MNTRWSNSTTVQELAIRVMKDAEKTRKACCGMDQTDTAIAWECVAERQEDEAEMRDTTEQMLK